MRLPIIGKLVLASNFPPTYDQVLALVSVEENTFGANHAEVSGYLLGLWGLPVPMVEAIARHHNPTQSTHIGFRPLTAVHAANVLVNFKQPPDKVLASDILDSTYLTLLGLEGRFEISRTTSQTSTISDEVRRSYMRGTS